MHFYLYIWRLGTDSQHKVDHHCNQKEDTQHGRAKSVIIWARASQPDSLSSPVIGDQCVDHGQHGNECEQTSTDSSNQVTEVQQTHTQGAQNDGEVQPGKEGSLIGEEHFWLDSGRQGDSLVGRH